MKKSHLFVLSGFIIAVFGIIVLIFYPYNQIAEVNYTFKYGYSEGISGIWNVSETLFYLAIVTVLIGVVLMFNAISHLWTE